MGREERKEAIRERLDQNLSEEQKENLAGVVKIAEHNKGNFFQSITFQNIIYRICDNIKYCNAKCEVTSFSGE